MRGFGWVRAERKSTAEGPTFDAFPAGARPPSYPIG